MINFPDYEYFNDLDISYSGFIQVIASVITKIAPFKETRTILKTDLMVEL